MARIARDRIPLTVCPLSNRALQTCPDLTRHPLKQMLAEGLVVTVNSDDPSYFGGYVNENFMAIQQALALTEADIATLVAQFLHRLVPAGPGKSRRACRIRGFPGEVVNPTGLCDRQIV